jgi:type II secretory pathway component PulF
MSYAPWTKRSPLSSASSDLEPAMIMLVGAVVGLIVPLFEVYDAIK